MFRFQSKRDGSGQSLRLGDSERSLHCAAEPLEAPGGQARGAGTHRGSAHSTHLDKLAGVVLPVEQDGAAHGAAGVLDVPLDQAAQQAQVLQGRGEGGRRVRSETELSEGVRGSPRSL